MQCVFNIPTSEYSTKINSSHLDGHVDCFLCFDTINRKYWLDIFVHGTWSRSQVLFLFFWKVNLISGIFMIRITVFLRLLIDLSKFLYKRVKTMYSPISRLYTCLLLHTKSIKCWFLLGLLENYLQIEKKCYPNKNVVQVLLTNCSKDTHSISKILYHQESLNILFFLIQYRSLEQRKVNYLYLFSYPNTIRLSSVTRV